MNRLKWALRCAIRGYNIAPWDFSYIYTVLKHQITDMREDHINTKWRNIDDTEPKIHRMEECIKLCEKLEIEDYDKGSQRADDMTELSNILRKDMESWWT
jgi:hypothetical protein